MQIRSVLVHFHSTGYITLNLPHSFTGVASYTPLPPTKKKLKKSSSAKSVKAAVDGCKVADVYKLSEVQVDFVG